MVDESKCIVLTFACMCHANKPKDSIVTAEKSHQTRISKELGASLFTLFICSFEGLSAFVKNRHRNFESIFKTFIFFICLWSLARCPGCPLFADILLHGDNILL